MSGFLLTVFYSGFTHKTHRFLGYVPVCLNPGYNGMLVPNLTQLRYKLSVHAADNLMYCSPPANSLLQGLNSRNAVMFSLDLSAPEAKDAVMAAVSHPQYKLKWVPPNKRDEMTCAFVDVVDKANKLSSLKM